MTVHAIDRSPAPQRAAERETLCGVLDFLRATVVNKVAGLSEQQARSTPVPPSTMTPIGLVKHLTAIERWWFSIDFAALDVTPPWPDGEPFDGFELADGDTLTSVVSAYLAECAASREVVAASGLDDPAQAAGMDFNLRYALVHMIEETGRHCGHLDLMRESLDGERGQ
ncbi:DinB family protein [Actinomycetes bacterium KLBMP 9797]